MSANASQPLTYREPLAMPYAIYQLEIEGQLVSSFISLKKDEAGVLGDVTSYILRNVKKKKFNPTAKSLEADLCIAMSMVSDRLSEVALRVIEVIDAETEGKIDYMLHFLDRAKYLIPELTTSGNQSALITINRIEFGINRVVNNRLHPGYVHLTDEEKAEVNCIFTEYYHKAFVFLSTAADGYSEEAHNAAIARFFVKP